MPAQQKRILEDVPLCLLGAEPGQLEALAHVAGYHGEWGLCPLLQRCTGAAAILPFLVVLLSALMVQSSSHALTSGPPQDSINGIIIHAISGPRCNDDKVEFSGAEGSAADWKRYFDENPVLGIHYIVDRDGNTVASIPETQVANHALGHNRGTIGIELVHNGDGVEPFGEKQLTALARLIRSIRSRFDISIASIKSHDEIDSRTFECGGRNVKTKSDPGPNFPWQQFRAMLEPKE